MDKIIKNLKGLKGVEPDFEWSVRTKKYLLSQINTVKEKENFSDKLRVFTLRLERKFIPSPVKIVATLLVFMLAGGTTLAAKAAIPGNPLYPLKTRIEKVELVFVTSSKKEAKVHLRHAKNRVFEVEQLAKQGSSESEEQINQVVINLKNNITAAQNYLESAENEGEDIEKVVEVAVQVNEGAGVASQVLNQTVTNITSEETKKKVNEAAEATDTIQESTTNLIVDKKATGEVSDEVVTNEKVKEIVIKNLNRIEGKNNIVKEKVSQVVQEKVNEAIKQKQEGEVITSNDLNEEEVEKMITKPEEAGLILEEARKLVEEDSLSEAMDKAKTSQDITKDTEKVLEKIDEILAGQEEAITEENNEENIINPSLENFTTTTILEIEPIIELGGINNEEDPYINGDTEEEPVIENTPILTGLEE